MKRPQRCRAVLRQMRDGKVYAHNCVLSSGHLEPHQCGRHATASPDPCEWFVELGDAS